MTESLVFTIAYSVTFTESGLPSGTSWSVTLNGTTNSSSTSSIGFLETNGAYAFTVGTVSGYTASPSSGSVTVHGAAVSESITFTAVAPGTYAVTFTESGLPSGTSWSVTLNGTMMSSTGSTISFTEKNGAYPYTVGAVTGYVATPSSGSVTVNGAPVSESITFTAVAPGTYAVTFTESGLPSGTSWSVTLNGTTMSSTGSTISFTEKNGTYDYTVGAVSGYAASPSSGSVTVSGAAVSVSITFSKLPVVSGPAYALTFSQTGLPPTVPWTVTCSIYEASPYYPFAETNFGATIEFAVPNQSYVCVIYSENSSYVAVPEVEAVVVNGAPLTFTIAFEERFAVTFTETGLATSALWYVTLNGTNESAYAGESIEFDERNGSYPYSVYAFGYTAAPSSGTVHVTGAPASVAITFTALPSYLVTFTESGLVTGAYWDVDLNGIFNETTAPSSITFSFPNGVYAFTVYTSAYYTPSPETGTVTVSSAPISHAIVFTAIPTDSVTFTESGLASGTTWTVTLNVTTNGTTAPGSIGFKAPAGVNFFVASAAGYTASPASGDLTVSGATTQTIAFTKIPAPTTYRVTLNESGLPEFSGWGVYFESNIPVTGYYASDYSCSNGTTTLTTGPSALNCTLADGYYTWTAITDTANYSASPMTGGLIVDGAAVTAYTTFVNTSSEYLVAFYWEWFEGVGGLPNGTTWSVTFDGKTNSTNGTTLFFYGPNATREAYTVTPPAGYVAIASSGNVTGYANPYSSELYYLVSPIVLLVFVPDPPTGHAPGPSSVVAAFTPVLAVNRDP